jgi:hypothetical protein
LIYDRHNRHLHPQISMKIMRNLSALLARRLILANAKVDLLSAYWSSPPTIGRDAHRADEMIE